MQGSEVKNGQVRVSFINANGGNDELVVDHVIGAIGFRFAISKLKFLHETIRRQICIIEDTPLLSSKFESCVAGLYMVGIASANSFGPVTRFAYGAKLTAKRISAHLAQRCSA
jgi:hypothetical protein